MLRTWIYVVSFFVPVLSVISNAQVVEATADTYIRGAGNTGTNYSTEGNLFIKNSNGGGTDRKGYIRFDVAGGVAEASLNLTVTVNNQGGGGSTPQVFTVEVYGLSESLDHTWVESEITWDNAPGNSLSDHEFTADATFLGSFLVDQLSAGDAVSFSDPALVDFINQDTDNQITLLLRRTTGNGSYNLGFASKENTGGHAVPTLSLRVASQAFRPNPANEATDVPRDNLLSWTPGIFARPVNGHIVYLSESFMDVNDGMNGTPQDANSYTHSPRLDFGTTYYWRVDEVNEAPDNTVHRGDVWSFQTEPYSIPIPSATIAVTASSASNEFSGPEKTLDGSGLEADGTHAIQTETMWFTAMGDMTPWIQYEFEGVKKLDTMKVWNSNSSAEGFIGYGVQAVLIEYSLEGETWDLFEDVNEFSRAPGLPTYDQYDEITLGGIAAKRVRLTIQSNFGGFMQAYSLSEVRFSMIPAAARTPVPESGSAGVLPNGVVSWRAGRESAQSTVSLSTDPNEVADGLAASVTSNTNSLDLGAFDLQLGQTYYWRVDEVNEAEATSVWAGPVWHFSTVPYLTVEDFDAYGNLSPARSFQTWLDGIGYSADAFFPTAYNGNGTGAAIGHDIWALDSPHYNGDIMETVNTMAGSAQSMPFYYTNAGAVASQTERAFSVPQDWTVGGAKTLSIAFAGQLGNTGSLYAKINNTKVTYDRDPQNITLGVWQTWPIDLSSMDVQTVTKLQIGVEGTGAAGMLLFDDIRLYARVGEVITPTDPGTDHLFGAWNFDEGSGTVVADNSGNGLAGTIVGATWSQGKEGAALLFAEMDYVETGHAGVTGTGSRTCAAWIKTGEANRVFLSWGLNTAGKKWRMRLDATGGLRIEVNGGYHYGQAFLADDEWHHTAVVLEDDDTPDVSETLLYVDGLPETTRAVLDEPIDTDANGELRIGKSTYDSTGFIGLIDGVRVYDRALSAGELRHLAGRTTPADKPF